MYKCRKDGTDEEVAIKVRRPGVEQLFVEDLAILGWLLALTAPSWLLMMPWTTARPRPVPSPSGLVVK